MIDLRRFAEERPMSLSAAADYIGKLTGQPKPNVSTLWRWCLKGCKGVKLESVCIGSKRYVTASAIERFIAARSQPGATTPPTTVTIDRHSSPRVQAQSDRRTPSRRPATGSLSSVRPTGRPTGGRSRWSRFPPRCRGAGSGMAPSRSLPGSTGTR